MDDSETKEKKNADQEKIFGAVSTIFRTTNDLDNGLQLWRVFPSKQYRDYKAACSVFKETAYKYIHAQLQQIRVRY